MTLSKNPKILIQNLSFAEFLRPRILDELTLPDKTIQKLQAMIDSKNIMNMIFYGPPGTGKTSCAKIMLNPEEFDVIQINASKENSLNVVRDLIAPFTTSMSLYQTKKVVFLDEADYLTESAQASLRCIIEQCSENCRFIFTANNLSKFHEAIQSRCMPICFDVPLKSMPSAITKVENNIKTRLLEIDSFIDDDKLHEIVEFNYPDYRVIANKIHFELL